MIFDLKSNAKIKELLPNGYHLLDMIMIPISLSDKISGEIYDTIGDLEIKTDTAGIPTDKRNILYKIMRSFTQKVEFLHIKSHFIWKK